MTSVRRPQLGGERAPAHGRAGRFALVGIVNTIIDFVAFGVLATVGVPLLLANFISTSAGMTFGFFAHRAFSFRSDRPLRETAVPFLLTTATGLWIVQPVVIHVVADLLPAVLDAGAAVTGVWVPKACAIGVAMVWNFALYHFVVFPSRPGADG